MTTTPDDFVEVETDSLIDRMTITNSEALTMASLIGTLHAIAHSASAYLNSYQHELLNKCDKEINKLFYNREEDQ